MELGYETLFDNLHSCEQYNGNISAIRWQSAHNTGRKAYRFYYDELNRLNTALYREGADLNTKWEDNPNAFSLRNVMYDLNGNIQQLGRNRYFDHANDDHTPFVNTLGYTYSGNKLISLKDNFVLDETMYQYQEEIQSLQTVDNGDIAAVTTPVKYYGESEMQALGMNGESGGATPPAYPDSLEHDSYIGNQTSVNHQYFYDKNGNLIEDFTKGMYVYYNSLNLPVKVDFGSGNRIEYKYTASGMKLRKEVYEGNTLSSFKNYISGIEYDTDGLELIHTEEGRIVPKDDGTFRHEYFLKDHLGNVRVTFTDDGTNKAKLLSE